MFDRIGNAIEMLRQLRGLNQASLARAAGIGKSQLSKYINGKEKPKLESLERLLTVLRVSPTTFFSVVESLDRHAAELDEPGGLHAEGVLHGDLLPEPLQASFEKVVRGLFHLHAELVRKALFKGGQRGR